MVSISKEVPEMPKSPYDYGREQEEKVAQSLRGRGAKVKLSPGSKGAADAVAEFPGGTTWKIQVKSSATGSPASPSPQDRGRLKQSATKTGATPVIAEVTPQGIEYISARTGRKLKPPKRK